MLNKLLEQIQMMIGYQKSKKIGRFITLFFAISVGTYLLLEDVTNFVSCLI